MSFVVALTGFPGVGKLTVAQAIKRLTEQGTDTTTLIVDNHWINNPIFGLIAQDGITPLPAGVWEQVGEVTRAVFRTVESFTPREWNVVFTAYLDGETDTGWLPAVERIAHTRGAAFLPVRLVCDTDENARRTTQSGRRERMKSVDSTEPPRLASMGEPYDSGMSNSITADVTTLTPDEAAAVILSHIETTN